MNVKFIYHGPDDNPWKELELGDNEALWLARAFVGEHGKKDFGLFPVFAWCMINRFLLHPGNKHWPSFIYMLRRFSQPVNPNWMRGGKLAARFSESRMCTEARLNRRAKICKLQWDDMPVKLGSLVKLFCSTGMPTPPWQVYDMDRKRISNFAQNQKKLRDKYPHGKDIGGNLYFEDNRLRKGSVCLDFWEVK